MAFGLGKTSPGQNKWKVQILGGHNCDRLWDFGPYRGTWAKFAFLHNLTCSYVLSILVKFYVFIDNSSEVMSFQATQLSVV